MGVIGEQGRLQFEYEDGEAQNVTAYGGLPIVVELLRAFGVSAAVREHVRIGARMRKHDAAWMVESLVALMTAGGDCLDDIEVLRQDKALGQLLCRELPSAETARKFLYAFHDEQLIEAAARQAAQAGEASFVPEESTALAGLARAQQALVHAVAARRPCEVATVDVDATIIESHKRQAREHYEGGRGYQPEVAVWAELDVVLADEFRDGNVPAGKDPLAIVQRALATLPTSVRTRRLRADSALYHERVLKWLVRNAVQFTISADMGRELREQCESVGEHDWSLLETRLEEQVHVGEVEFYPGDWPKDSPALRYLVVRFTPTQGRLFDRGAGPKYLAVVTNREGEACELLRWHWQKAGTIEHVHDVVKNDLGGGVLPCGRFGASAAWFRLALITYNALSALRGTVLPPELSKARPKRLRLHVFVVPVAVVSHARQLIARIAAAACRMARLADLRAGVWRPVQQLC